MHPHPYYHLSSPVCVTHGAYSWAVNPPAHHQILRTDREGIIDDIISHNNDVICAKNAH